MTSLTLAIHPFELSGCHPNLSQYFVAEISGSMMCFRMTSRDAGNAENFDISDVILRASLIPDSGARMRLGLVRGVLVPFTEVKDLITLHRSTLSHQCNF
jgi:hypothetical protein